VGGLCDESSEAWCSGAIAWAFFRWYERENADSYDPRWDDVREELLRLGVPMAEPRGPRPELR
jgi:hypothetical protein